MGRAWYGTIDVCQLTIEGVLLCKFKVLAAAPLPRKKGSVQGCDLGGPGLGEPFPADRTTFLIKYQPRTVFLQLNGSYDGGGRRG